MLDCLTRRMLFLLLADCISCGELAYQANASSMLCIKCCPLSADASRRTRGHTEAALVLHCSVEPVTAAILWCINNEENVIDKYQLWLDVKLCLIFGLNAAQLSLSLCLWSMSLCLPQSACLCLPPAYLKFQPTSPNSFPPSLSLPLFLCSISPCRCFSWSPLLASFHSGARYSNPTMLQPSTAFVLI